MNRATFIGKLTEVQRTLEQLLAQLQSNEADKFVAHLYQARNSTASCAIARTREQGHRREVIATYQVAQSLGFKGDFRAWEHLLRIHE